jgi:hypothetical protein
MLYSILAEDSWMQRPDIHLLIGYACLYFSCTKLRHYLLSAEYMVVCKDDVVRYMLSLPILKGRTGKWILALTQFDLWYEPAKAVNG